MCKSSQLLLLIFDSSEQALEFHSSMLGAEQSKVLSTALIQKNEQGKLRIKRLYTKRGGVSHASFSPGMSPELQPKEALLLLYLEGDLIEALLPLTFRYQLRLLTTTTSSEVVAQLKQQAGGRILFANEEKTRAEAQRANTGDDDLTRIIGIGPKIAAVLTASGVDSYRKLAETNVEALRACLRSAGIIAGAILETWPEQALCALQQNWADLHAFKRISKRFTNR